MPKVKEKKLHKKTGKELNRYRLLAGAHEGSDPDWEPTEDDVEEAKARGTVPRAPVKRYKVGDTVLSDKDLVHMFGANKFQLVGGPAMDRGNLAEGVIGDPTPMNLESGLVHPHGQVNTGFQQTGGKDAFGNTVSGIISKEELEERGLLPEPPPDKTEKLEKQRAEAKKESNKGKSSQEEDGDEGEELDESVTPTPTPRPVRTPVPAPTSKDRSKETRTASKEASRDVKDAKENKAK
jgi:hypothetical protein